VLFENYHKFAIEWLPERIIYYFDDEPVYSSFNDESIPNNPQKIRMEFQLGGGGTWPDPNAPYPLEYIIDYFRYYQLDMSHCDSSVAFANNIDLNNFTFGVRKNITIGNGSSSISLYSGDNTTLRYSGELIINGEFTVPLGAELTLIPTPCY
jgi:beta-glucanase (GH16 family)